MSWSKEQVSKTQTDYSYCLNERYQLVVTAAQVPGRRLPYVWQYVDNERGTIMSAEMMGAAGYFSTFADALFSLQEFLSANFHRQIPREQIWSVTEPKSL